MFLIPEPEREFNVAIRQVWTISMLGSFVTQRRTFINFAFIFDLIHLLLYNLNLVIICTVYSLVISMEIKRIVFVSWTQAKHKIVDCGTWNGCKEHF